MQRCASIALVAGCLVGFLLLPGLDHPPVARGAPQSESRVAIGVQWHDEPVPNALDAFLAAHNGYLLDQIPQINVSILSLEGDYEELAAEARFMPGVRAVAQDSIATVTSDVNDPEYGSMGYLADIGVPTAWDTTHGEGVTIAIVDSGIDTAHPDLDDNIVAGYDFVDGDNDPYDPGCGHGTRVAGIAAAEGNNGIGVVGVAYRSRIMPIRVMNANCSGTLGTIAQGIIYAADHGADIINLSLNASDSLFMPSAIEYAAARDILVVSGAGNDGTYYDDNANMPPASEETLVVGGVSNLNVLYGGSNYGPHMVVAPAAGLRTTAPGGTYGGFSLTSAASPVVAGIAALVRAAHPTYTRSQLCWAIKLSALDLGETGQDVTFGWGKVNAASALAYALPDIVPAACGVNFEPPSYGWSHVINTSGSGSMATTSISSAAGSTAVTGSFTGIADFDPSRQRLLLASDGTGGQIATYLTVLSNGGRHRFTRMPLGSNADYGVAVAVAPSGKIALVTSFAQSLDFAGDQGDDIRSAQEKGIGVSLWNADGTYDHTFVLDSPNADLPYDASVDSDGNIYVVGIFRSTIDFDPGPATYPLTASDPSGDGFLASYTPGGAFRYAVKIGSAAQDYATGVAADDSQVYVVGRHGGTVDFDPGPGSDIRVGSGSFLSVYTRSGTYRWVRDFAGGAFPEDVAARGGQVYAVGRYEGTVDMDDGAPMNALVSAGSSDGFVVAFDEDGAYQWAASLGGAGEDVAKSVAANSAGHAVVGGSFTGSADFDPGPDEDLRSSVGLKDAFITTLDATGAAVGTWVRGTLRNDEIVSVHVDEHDTLHYAGTLGGPVNLATFGPADFAKQGAFYGQIFTELSLPSVTVTTESAPRGSIALTIDGHAQDADSPIAFVDYSLDPGADVWNPCATSAGQSPGSKDFTCQVDIPSDSRAAFVYVRAEDVTGNRTARSGYGRVPIVDGPTATPSPTAAPSATATPTATEPPTATPTDVPTATPTLLTATPTASAPATDTPTGTPTDTATSLPTPTAQDVTAPVVELVPVGPDPIAQDSVALRGKATDTDGTVTLVEYQVDSTAAEWTACLAADGAFDSFQEDFVCLPNGLRDGVHTVYVRAKDAAGNASAPVADTFLVDVAGAEPAYAGGVAECPASEVIIADRDTHIFGRSGFQGRNAGGSAKLDAQSKDGAKMHILLHFALDKLPAGAMIDRAQLRLTVESGPSANRTLSVRELLVGPWTEGTGVEAGTACAAAGYGATWNAPNCIDTTTAWNGSGGSFGSAMPYGPELGTIRPASDETPYTVDLTELVRGWYASPATNHGLVLLAVGSDTGTVKFHSRTGAAGKQPSLVIDYRVPVVGGCSGSFSSLAVADTDVDEANPTTWKGADAKLRTQPSPIGQRRFGLIRFDLSGIPAAAHVTAATLTLNVTDSRANHVDEIRGLTTAWSEGTSSANGAVWADPNGLAVNGDWASAGGNLGPSDYEPTVVGTIRPSTKGTKTIDVTSLVAAWHANPSTNKGLILLATGSDTGEAGYSSRSDATKGPRVAGSWRIEPANPERVTRLVVDRLLATAGDAVRVTMALENRSEAAVSSVAPFDFTFEGTNGAGATCSGPTPSSQNAAANSSVYFTWSCLLSAQSGTSGAVTFSGAARGDGGTTTWARATSRSVIVNPGGP